MQVLGTTQHEEWMGVLGRTAQHDFYHLPSYHQIAEQSGEGTAHLFVHAEGSHLIALPLLLRPLPGGAGAEWSDATSVYGYAGPVASHAELPGPVVHDFQQSLARTLTERRVVTAFSRLHPLIGQHGFLAGMGECRAHGHTVSIDLTLPADETRARFRASHRTRINKLRREGVDCRHDGGQRHLADFVSIYHETMHRVNAHDSYFFDDDYFAGLASGLGRKLHLFVVTAGKRIIAAMLVTICDGIVQYHLGGTRTEFLALSPMTLIIDTVRLWARENGARVFHLGGGVGSRKDSLLHFKAGFSERRHGFETWRWVVIPEVYRELCEARLEPVSADYFPAYRCPVSPLVAAPGEVANA